MFRNPYDKCTSHIHTQNQQRIYDIINKKGLWTYVCLQYYLNGVTSEFFLTLDNIFIVWYSVTIIHDMMKFKCVH